MRRWAFLLLLLSLAFAEYTLTAMDVVVDVDGGGNAKVTEKLHYIITSSYHISLYESGLTKTDLASWSSIINSSDVRYHLDNRVVNIENVVVRPAPTSRCNPLAELCHGELTISYDAKQYARADGSVVPETGIFSVDAYKPRSKKFTLNPGALSFETSELGDVILGENQRITIMLPQGATVQYVSPLPEETVEAQGRTQMSWQNAVLAHFSLVFEKEESLDQEVINFFMGARTELYDFLKGPQGMPALLLVLITAGSYFYLQARQKKAA
jgi:hypothetical protein